MTGPEMDFLLAGIRSLDDVQLEYLISIANQEQESRSSSSPGRKGLLKPEARSRLEVEKTQIDGLDVQFDSPQTEELN
jgi:hypothetical protein